MKIVNEQTKKANFHVKRNGYMRQIVINSYNEVSKRLTDSLMNHPKLRVFNTVLILLYLQYSVPVEPVSVPGSIVKALFNPPILLFLNA